MTIAAVLFDWGDTLVRYPGFSTDGGAHLNAVAVFYQWLTSSGHHACLQRHCVGQQNFVDSYATAAHEQFDQMHKSGCDQPLPSRLLRTFELTGCDCNHRDETPRFVFDRFTAILCDATEAMPNAVEVLRRLSTGYPLALVANYPEPKIVYETLRRYGLQHYFASIVISAEVGRVKPDPLPFRTALDALSVPPSQALFVGDDLVNDMAGANALGCVTAWLPPPTVARVAKPGIVDYTLSELNDLLMLPIIECPG